ncbi:hypothetical protein LRY58_00345 [Candidatus Woesebacteria bacterium]|nr:hypothetical protein [Candidatus Woesebacteria bacterium]
MRAGVRILLVTLFILFGFLRSASAAAATDYGMHVLRPEEIETIAAQTTELRQESSAPLYVTLPFSLDDTKDLDRWRTAFRVAKENNIVPLVRLVTRFDTEANAWAVPISTKSCN